MTCTLCGKATEEELKAYQERQDRTRQELVKMRQLLENFEAILDQ